MSLNIWIFVKNLLITLIDLVAAEVVVRSQQSLLRSADKTLSQMNWNVLGHGERQVVIGHLDFVLGFQVSHPLRADAINGNNDITLDQVTLRRFAAWSDLFKHNNIQTSDGFIL